MATYAAPQDRWRPLAKIVGPTTIMFLMPIDPAAGGKFLEQRLVSPRGTFMSTSSMTADWRGQANVRRLFSRSMTRSGSRSVRRPTGRTFRLFPR